VDVVGSPESIQPPSLVMYLNGVLPDDVKVLDVQVAPPGFDSHGSGKGKAYHYKISSGLPDPLEANQRWWVYSRWCDQSRGKPQSPEQLLLDVPAMQEAAAMLLGTHDFSAFMDNRRPSGSLIPGQA